ncbi:MAG: hypothetical protein AVDCRST_MAG13-827 [uncultured Solirubrobacteraceae bacterium]|uniref:Uncharacterized protein n=1 Tax=uncultured Solirubrobacteraceae bacterium TaxID=1162706 RepID=A0A6J4RKR0_9ACTN|nr:MAG: hypothetical protein AVDCRST_MAG13-827 [uncultured Solirubrobacteraceae bacterium]
MSTRSRSALGMNAAAPRPRTSGSARPASSPESTMTAVRGDASTSSGMASSPDIPGMERSSSTASGRSRSTCSMQPRPSQLSPTTCMSSCAHSSARTSRRKVGSSSQRASRSTAGPP